MSRETLTSIRNLLINGDIRKAEASISRLLRAELSRQEEAETLTLRARARLLAARPEEALDDITAAGSKTDSPALLAELLELTGDAHFARFELASVGFADRTTLKLAHECYNKLVHETPQYPNLGWVHYQRGRLFLTEGDTDSAIQCLTQALLSPSPLPRLTAYCFERLGFIHVFERRDLYQALGFLNKALYTYPSIEARVWIARLQTLRSRVLRELGKTDEAIEAVETAIGIAQQSDDGKIALADALLTAGELYSQMQGHEKNLITRLQQYLQFTRRPLGIDVTWSRVHEMLGNAYFSLGQYSQSAESYRNALQYNPYHPWEITLQYQMARAYYQSDAYDQAIEAINRLLNTSTSEGQSVTDYRVFDILGSAQFARKHYAEALAAYDQALALAPPATDVDKIKRYRQFAAELSASS